MRPSKIRVRLETAVALLAGLLGVVTIFWHDWIEALTGWDPDHQRQLRMAHRRGPPGGFGRDGNCRPPPLEAVAGRFRMSREYAHATTQAPRILGAE
jgi:hypothetical protein